MATRGSFRFLSWLFLTVLMAGTNLGWAQNPGATLPALGKRIPLDSIVELKTFKPEEPKVFPAHPNVHPAGQPKVIPIPSELPVFTPGENGLALPRTVKAEGISVPALQPAPMPALPPKMREGARYDIQYMDADNGLSSNDVNAILEDKQGYLWFVTSNDGVNRYDGKNLSSITIKDGEQALTMLSAMVDHRGNIWFGCWYGKIVRYNGQDFTIFSLDNPSLGVLTIMEGRQGDIWFGTTAGGAVRYDGAHFTYYSTDQGLSHNNVQAIFEDSRGDIWFGTPNGLNRFDGRSFTRYAQKDGLFKAGAIVEDNQGNLWFGSRIGALRFDGKNFARYPSVRSKLKDSRGNLWFTSVTGGVCRFDGAAFTHYTTKEGLPDNSAYGIWEEDSGGNIWITAGGVSCLNPRSFVHFTELGGKKSGGVSSILEDHQGKLWFNTDNNWLVQYDGQYYTQITANENTHIFLGGAMRGDKHGNLWFLRSQAASRYDGNNFTKFGIKSVGSKFVMFWSILEDNQENIWFGTDTGAFRFDGESLWQYTEKEGLATNGVGSILEDSQRNIWFGTDGSGISRFDGKKFTNFGEKEGFNGLIAAMMEDSRGNIWFGARGLNRYDGRNFTSYSTEDGLSHFMVKSIIEDRSQNLWIGTQQGITLMAPVKPQPGSDSLSEKSLYRFYTFSKADGLNELYIRAAVLDRHNRLWLGTNKGLSMLDLNEFELASKPPRVMLEHIELNQKYIDFRQLADSAYLHSFEFGEALARSFDSIVPFFNYPASMELPHYLNNLAFHFSGIDWAAPHKVQYQFYLEGLEEDWNDPTKENKVEYRNLPFGHFTFKVQAMGESQEWSAPFEYTFTIRPPWYRTWLAYLLWASLLLGILYGIYRFQLSRKLAQAEARRLKELDTFKSSLYTNITHEFRTPLTVILGMADQVTDNPKEWLGEGMQLIKRYGRQLLHLINQMLDLAKLESGSLPVHKVQGDIVQYLRYLTESFHSFAESKAISLHFSTELEKYTMDYDPEKVLHIVSNLLSNAIKFTPANKHIYFQVTEAQKANSPCLQLTVKDTGRGIPADKLPHIFDRFYQADTSATRPNEGTGIGLAITRELVQLLGGSIEVSSKVGEGATFIVFLPARKEAATPADPGNFSALKQAISPFMGPSTQEAPEAEASLQPLSPDKPLLLIVEDNRDVIRYLMACLEPAYQLITAENGKIGVEKAIEIVPDIIISDVMMPEMDGFELCDTLKNDEKTSHIPIVLLTAKADVASKIAGLKRGADAYLPKPFHKEELLAQLANLVGQRKKLQLRYQGAALPEPAPEDAATAMEDAFLQKVRALVEDNMDKADFDISWLAHEAAMSRVQLFRKVKALTDQSPSMFVRAIRLQKAKTLLRAAQLNISEIAYEVGFSDPAFFSRVFREEFGQSPTEYREERGPLARE